MPSAIVYTLQPLRAARVPANLGRATHAAVLRLIRDADPALAERVHDDEGLKPLTVSNVLGLGPGKQVEVTPERTYGLRVTLLSEALEALAPAWTPEALGELDLDGHAWRVVARAEAPDDDAWAGRVAYTELAAPLLERPGEQPSRWSIQFAAPVTFRRRGANVPLPMPELVFGSLLEKWNAFAPIALPDEVRRYAEECLAVSRYDLRTIASPTSNGALQIGAVGRCTYISTNHDRYWQACITTLARFALYSGIGAGAARGWGQARMIGDSR